MERYIEAIYALQNEGGSASITDIAKVQKVKAPSVTYIVRRLRDLGLVNYKRYGSVTLTSKGLKLAEELERTHGALKWFFMLIGVDEKIADSDACELEHFVAPLTVEKLTEFAEWVKGAPKDPTWIQHFREYQRTGKRIAECS